MNARNQTSGQLSVALSAFLLCTRESCQNQKLAPIVSVDATLTYRSVPNANLSSTQQLPGACRNIHFFAPKFSLPSKTCRLPQNCPRANDVVLIISHEPEPEHERLIRQQVEGVDLFETMCELRFYPFRWTATT